ncbi:hypothetical protein P3W85_31165 [Cupriavidus basilensis]|uniref:Uncharacterized protein n=1 Tax=Cupriavidus basilensis TaxID=68895 RepID=A0ABT6AXL4_9BURK|nr:hypothetical protein [Cupriavidus basilensis]MDF3837375.1 hypothetical protein [Cupriavidus basilensis]
MRTPWYRVPGKSEAGLISYVMARPTLCWQSTRSSNFSLEVNWKGLPCLM